MVLSVSHRDGPAGRLHEAVVRIRGVDRPLAVYHEDDDVGTALLETRAADLRRAETQWERNADEFRRDDPLTPPQSMGPG